jgi:GTPase
LRHVERARALLVLLDLSAVDAAGPTPAEQEEILLRELGEYSPELLTRPRLVIGTKLDTLDGEEEIAQLLPGCPEILVSAATGQNLRTMLIALAPLIAEARAAQPMSDTFVVHRPDSDGIELRRNDDGSWSVLGRAATRAVAVSDLNNPLALAHVRRQLDKLGVNKTLLRAGAKSGDIVRIGTFSFDLE